MDHPSLNFKGQSFQADRNVIPRYWDFPVIVVQSLTCVWLFATHGLPHARLPCPSLSPEVCSDSCPLSWWCYPTISSSAALFSFCLQSFPSLGSFLGFPWLPGIVSGFQALVWSRLRDIQQVSLRDDQHPHSSFLKVPWGLTTTDRLFPYTHHSRTYWSLSSSPTPKESVLLTCKEALPPSSFSLDLCLLPLQISKFLKCLDFKTESRNSCMVYLLTTLQVTHPSKYGKHN